MSSAAEEVRENAIPDPSKSLIFWKPASIKMWGVLGFLLGRWIGCVLVVIGEMAQPKCHSTLQCILAYRTSPYPTALQGFTVPCTTLQYPVVLFNTVPHSFYDTFSSLYFTPPYSTLPHLVLFVLLYLAVLLLTSLHRILPAHVTSHQDNLENNRFRRNVVSRWRD